MLSHLMLFFVLADVISNFLYVIYGRSYCHNFGRCYCLWLVVDVDTTLEFLIINVEIFFCWLMLLPMHFFVADLIAIHFIAVVIPLVFTLFWALCTGRCYCHGGRWNGHLGWSMIGRCYSHGGWWCCHWSAISVLVLRCSTEPHPICVADGICLHSY